MTVDVTKLRELLAAAAKGPFEAQRGCQVVTRDPDEVASQKEEHIALEHQLASGKEVQAVCEMQTELERLRASEYEGEIHREHATQASADQAALMAELERLRRLEAADIAMADFWDAHGDEVDDELDAAKINKLEEVRDACVAEARAAAKEADRG